MPAQLNWFICNEFCYIQCCLGSLLQEWSVNADVKEEYVHEMWVQGVDLIWAKLRSIFCIKKSRLGMFLFSFPFDEQNSSRLVFYYCFKFGGKALFCIAWRHVAWSEDSRLLNFGLTISVRTNRRSVNKVCCRYFSSSLQSLTSLSWKPLIVESTIGPKLSAELVPRSNLFALFQVSIRSQRIALCRRFYRR